MLGVNLCLPLWVVVRPRDESTRYTIGSSRTLFPTLNDRANRFRGTFYCAGGRLVRRSNVKRLSESSSENCRSAMVFKFSSGHMGNIANAPELLAAATLTALLRARDKSTIARKTMEVTMPSDTGIDPRFQPWGHGFLPWRDARDWLSRGLGRPILLRETDEGKTTYALVVFNIENGRVFDVIYDTKMKRRKIQSLERSVRPIYEVYDGSIIIWTGELNDLPAEDFSNLQKKDW